MNSAGRMNLPAPAPVPHHPGNGEQVAIKIAAVAVVAALSYGAAQATAITSRRPDEDVPPVAAVEIVDVTAPMFIPADANDPGGLVIPGTSPSLLAPAPIEFLHGPDIGQLELPSLAGADGSGAVPAPQGVSQVPPPGAGVTPASAAPAQPALPQAIMPQAPTEPALPPAAAATPVSPPAAEATAVETPAAVDVQRTFYVPEVSHGPATSIETNLFDSINAERANAGLAPYAYDTSLSVLARTRAKQMADQGYFGHRDPYGYTMYVELLSRESFWYRWAGENLAKNNYGASEAAQRAVISLMNSGPHRANLLDTDFDRIDVGVYTTPDGIHFMAMIFLG